MTNRTAAPTRTASHPAVTGYLARYSGPSRATHAASLRRFLAWCDSQSIEPLNASRVDIEMYRHYLTEDQGLKNSTVYGYLATVSTWFKVAVHDGWVNADPTVMVRRPKVIYDDNRLTGLSRHDVEKLLLHAHSRSPKHAALVMLLGSLGLRASEAANVRIEDFESYIEGHRVLHLVGKGSRPATIPLPPLVFRVLDKCSGGRTSGYLIQTRTGGPLSRHDVYRWVRTLGHQSGLGHIKPHQLRHASITAILDAGADRRGAIAFGRWADGRMVDHYDRNLHSLHHHPAYLIGGHHSSIAHILAA